MSAVQYTLHKTVDSGRFFLSSYTGGTIINSGYLQTKTVFNLSSPTDFNFQIGRSLTNPSTPSYTSDIILVAMAGTSNNQVILAELGWYEY